MDAGRNLENPSRLGLPFFSNSFIAHPSLLTPRGPPICGCWDCWSKYRRLKKRKSRLSAHDFVLLTLLSHATEVLLAGFLAASPAAARLL
jgi:hypothetical protein